MPNWREAGEVIVVSSDSEEEGAAAPRTEDGGVGPTGVETQPQVDAGWEGTAGLRVEVSDDDWAQLLT